MVLAFKARRLTRAGFTVAGIVAGALGLIDAARAEVLTVNVDQSKIVKLPDRVATVVIGNPLIADATLQNGGLLVLTGKGFGATNMIALDRAGRTVESNTVQVVGPGTHDLVVVYRGVERESYSCAPNCERRITLGDSPAYFSAVLSQTGQRNGSAAPPAK